MNRLWVRLTLAFLAVAFVAVGLVAVVSARTTGEEFRQYVVGQGMMAAQPAWTATLEGYYARNGSWRGVESILSQLSPGMGGGMGAMGPGRGGGPANLAVADAAGRVVASRSGEFVGERLPANVLAQGSALAAPNGQIAGTLLNIRSAQVTLDAQGQSFLNQVRASVAWSALAAVLLALALGIVVSRWLAAPLVRMTRAATAIAGGDLRQQVTVGGSEEFGQLGLAFNQMASNLAQAEALRRNMVADIAHELRTPLTVIQGNLQAMLDGVYPLDADQVASLHDETRLLTRLVDDLRDLALADAGQLRLDRQPVDLADLARSAVTNFAPAADAGEIDLRLQADEDGPIVLGDADRLA
ncbi:MAG TPA: histidine kinase dimerization/phospho-acceptor domain-containing protein, partial [Anaerolineae bacterium]